MRLACLLGLTAVLASSSHAQTAGTCETGSAQRFLENDQLRISLFNTGGLFFGGSTTSSDGYLIPKGQKSLSSRGDVSPLLTSGLWLGGYVDTDLRVAAARYGSWDFWPGPLEDAHEPPSACFAYDRIYVVSRADIQRYYQTGELADDLRDWPHQLGAPVIDGDGDPTNYDLRAGDQPDLIGDMAAWWVMNDAGGEHGISGPNGPLGVEVRAHAFLYGLTTETTSPVLLQTTFVRYEIVNRGHQPIEQMHASMFSSVTLGDAGDNYFGSDTLRHMGVAYNDSNQDSAYGSPPPAIGIQVLQGPIGLSNERIRMTAANRFIDGGPDGAREPSIAEEYYNYMRGLWGDGTPYYEYGSAYGWEEIGVPKTPFMFAGNPVTESFYSEVNVDNRGSDSPQGDRSLAVSTGPFRLAPDSSQTLLYAFPYGQGTSHLQSVEVLQWRGDVLQRLAADGFFASRPVPISRPQPTLELALSKPAPNPSRQPEVLLTLPEATHVRATVYDALGRQLEVLVDGELPEGPTVLTMPAGLAPGLYQLRVQVAPGAVETLSFTVVR